MAIFEQRTRAHRDGAAGGFNEGEDVALQTCRECGAAEGIEDDGIVGIGERKLVEIIVVHEFLEEVGAEHHRLWNHHRGIVKLVEFGMMLHDVVDEGKTTTFASQRTFSDARKNWNNGRNDRDGTRQRLLGFSCGGSPQWLQRWRDGGHRCLGVLATRVV